MADFKQSVKWMKEGKKIRIIGWMSDRYLELDKPGNIWDQSEGNNRDLRHYFSMYEFASITWEIYKEQTCNKCTREYSGDSCPHCKEELTTTGEYNYGDIQGDITINDHLDNNNIQFNTKDCNAIIELKENGDIYVKGKLIENDKEVVDGMRELLGFDKVKKESLSDKIWTQEQKPIYHDLPDMVSVKNIKKSIKKLKKYMHLSIYNSEVIKLIFGDRLTK